MIKSLKQPHKLIPRPPVVCVLGHVDHGKSTLLDYIRKTNIVKGEAGGITQKLSAYEVDHKDSAGKIHRLTFLDTPGHASFCDIRSRGASVADVAILVVSAEDGVKPQTLEALKCILDAKIPYVIAINKIDKPNADLERTKQNLAENEIYIEGYGGSVPFEPTSSTTGKGISELLDLVILSAELQEHQADDKIPAEGVVIETEVNSKKGISAVIIIRNGSFHKGDCFIAGTSFSPGRIIENFAGQKITEATFSSPVKISGFDSIPPVGAKLLSFDCKKASENHLKEMISKSDKAIDTKLINCQTEESEGGCVVVPTLPIVLKADTAGSLEALNFELKKFSQDKLVIKIVNQGVGDITENDIKSAGGKAGTLIVGFNVKADSRAKSSAERLEITINTFDIIYHLTEWLEKIIAERTPKQRVEEIGGEAKVLKIFSRTKNRYVAGGRVETGTINQGSEVKIIRRDSEIGTGEIRGLQQNKEKTSEVEAGKEFGVEISSSIELAPGDKLRSIKTTFV